MSARWQSKSVSAVLVWDALDAAGSIGLTLDELEVETGMSRCQVKAGLAYVNQTLQLAKKQPIMVVIGTWERVLPQHYVDLKPWSVNRLQDVLTRLRTERTRTLAAEQKWPRHVRRTIRRDFDRLIEDLADVLVDLT